MGFATAENIGYVLQHGFATGMIRMFMSVPAHACFAVMMGYYVGKARFDKHNRDLYLRMGIVLAALFHGLYDFFLMLAADQQITQNTSSLLLIAGAIISYLIVFRYSIKAIQLHRNISKIKHENAVYSKS
jgi:RsiW-degrading membrane proteinase PrsW (M82 family)